jgi:hypothetical protein
MLNLVGHINLMDFKVMLFIQHKEAIYEPSVIMKLCS